MILGLTGNFGSGKSTVANMFKELGAIIIDVDEIGYKVLNGECYKEVVNEFGSEVLDYDLKIDRSLLMEIVFNRHNDKTKLKKLEAILHPRMLSEVEKELRRLDTKHSIVIIEAAILIELGLLGLIDKLIVVICNRQQERLNLSKDEIMQILDNQMDESALEAKADFTADNNGGLENTKKQVDEIWNKLSIDI